MSKSKILVFDDYKRMTNNYKKRIDDMNILDDSFEVKVMDKFVPRNLILPCPKRHVIL